ncbi:serine/threonine kinase receptor associated protein [Flagelloscypha sp. PMI_526]|nr:serine/threonine kinase receptor associated protein [Flagelloscypha sp. PMI_526]
MSLPKSTPLVAPGHTRPVTHISFSQILDDGTFMLVSSCKDGNPMLREWTGDWIGTFLGHKGAVWSTKLSLDASKAATGSADFTAKIWDTFTGNVLHSFPHNHIVRSVALGPQANHLLTGGQEKKVRIFDLARPDADPDFLLPTGSQVTHEGTVKSVVWVGEHTGVTAGEDGHIKPNVWWSPSGNTVAFIPMLPTGAQTHSLNLTYKPSSATVHPILQDRFVTGNSGDEWVRVHGMDGEEREFSPDGEMYASGSGTIRLWQTTPGKTYGLWA